MLHGLRSCFRTDGACYSWARKRGGDAIAIPANQSQLSNGLVAFIVPISFQQRMIKQGFALFFDE